ncbi:ABC transporter [candidate division LCP-89 bacterium B3_LCP]|uniref:ABC transporter n=1 Tax=candidate division LCP-89 bacterium B3_LCP TaxID=2012998 RepID=A0A532V5P1_UNCL8|nr:MAG: ABC transporter [candidate division LCP-89 bacterium B3_LCP]
MIDVKNLSKSYGETLAVDNISFEVQKGEILGFLGPNGAGKTTTMKILTCFMPPTSGDVTIDGLPIWQDSLEIRQKIGYLPEQNPLYHDMSVLDYLRFVAELRRIPKESVKSRIKYIVEVCGLKEVITRIIGELSKGYRQRVGLAQAMIHDPQILILDEPTSGLDPNQIVEIRNLIRELGKEKTVILSTHILSEVQATCNRAIIVNEGEIVADGALADLQSTFHGLDKINLEIKAPENGCAEKLRAIDYVKQVTEKEAADELHQYVVEVEKGHDLREQIFDLSVREGWKLLELHQESTSLEDVFRQLTRG